MRTNLRALPLAAAFAGAAFWIAPLPVAAQCVSLTTLGAASSQSFDTLATTGTTSKLTITGWFLTEIGGGSRDNERYGADNGSSNTGDTYSYGATGSSERALGGLRSGSLVSTFGACFTNNTGSTVTSLAIAYTGEEWRLGTAGRTDRLTFELSTNATSLTSGTWTGVVALDFVTPDTATGGAKNGNAAAERTALSATISPLSIASGATVWIRWTDSDASGADDGLAVDAFSLTPGSGAVAPNRIHELQGSGAATPIPPATEVTVEGVVTASFQGSDKLQGFFLQEEDADADADPATSEGIFVSCGGCPTPVAEGQRVRATGLVAESSDMTQLTVSAAGSVVVTEAGNHLAAVTPAPVDLPVAGDVNAFYEAREGMRVTFLDTLSVAEYFQFARFGQIVLYEGDRPRQFTETSAPSAAGLAAHRDDLARRRVILDDDDNAQNAPLALPDGSQFVFHPQAGGGFSTGTQGTDFFRGGDQVAGLTGVLHWSPPGTGASWRIRPTAASPAAFTVANPRPAAPAVDGAIRAASMNLLNYFTTLDTTSSSSSGPCGPAMNQDCRGADSAAELSRQRERASIVICALNADVYAFMELENTTATGTVDDLLGAVNARCGGADPYVFAKTVGTLGTDTIRVAIIYRSATLSPVGSPLVDLDPSHNRPPTAQTFEVIAPANPALGQRFTVIANHFKSKGCDASATGADADAGDGQSCYNGRRTAQANRLLAWISGTVLPAAGDPDVLLLGDFNAYAQEDPVSALAAGGFTDVASALLGPASYSYLFDSQLGHLDYAFASASLVPQIAGIANWHVNADESDLFDYNDEIRTSGEGTFEEKPDGSALVTPRILFEAGSPYRASDHDPVLVGLF